MVELDRKEWKKMFKHFDANSDGTISCKELERALQYVGFNPTPDEVQTYMQQMAKNPEDGIEFQEFFDFVQTLKDPAGELIEAFKKYDKNGDGFIDKTEIRALFTSGNFDECEIDNLFDVVDVNSDGKIDFKEFVAIFTQNT